VLKLVQGWDALEQEQVWVLEPALPEGPLEGPPEGGHQLLPPQRPFRIRQPLQQLRQRFQLPWQPHLPHCWLHSQHYWRIL
jgi:hypothetical protein